MKPDEVFARLDEAVAFLSDDSLVWSDDFEIIRRPLADLLKSLQYDLGPYFESFDPLEALLGAILGDDETPEEMQAFLDFFAFLAAHSERRRPRFRDRIRRLFGRN